MTSLVIATPCYGDQMLRGYVVSLLNSRQQLQQRGGRLQLLSFGNESLITRARNNMVAQFMSSDCDTLMFIDADITWDPAALMALLDSPYEVCGIPYPTKSYDWDKITRLINDPQPLDVPMTTQRLHNISRRFTINYLPDDGQPLPPGWRKVESLGTGFLMIRRSALVKMLDCYRSSLGYVNDIAYYQANCKPEYCVAIFDTLIDPVSRRYLSEDYAFCKRWRDIGGEVFACMNHRLIHTGSASF
jgi:hypothetical protein